MNPDGSLTSLGLTDVCPDLVFTRFWCVVEFWIRYENFDIYIALS